MTWQLWLLFVATEAVLDLTPGPAVMLVVSQSLARGPRGALPSSAGILAMNLVYFVLSATGLGALLLASYRVFEVLKWLGAAYLVFLGVQTLVSKHGILAAKQAGSEGRPLRLFLNAVAMQGANPKALLFFVALLPQFITPGPNVGRQFAILALTSVVIEFAILWGYGQLAGRAAKLARSPRFARATNSIAGLLLIGSGLKLATTKR